MSAFLDAQQFAPEDSTSPPVVGPPVAVNHVDEDSLIDAEESFQLLGEIVGGSKLGPPCQDDSKDDGLSFSVSVHLDGTRVHETAAVSGRNPVWTVSTQALFVLPTTSTRELIDKDMIVSVWCEEKDPLRLTTLSCTQVGSAVVPVTEIVASGEERFDVDLRHRDVAVGSLTLRFRLAAPADERFLGTAIATAPPASIITEQDETELAGSTFVNALSTAFTRHRAMLDSSAGTTKTVLCKPGPDPDQPETTTQLSPEEIKRQSMLPSKEWIEAGSGSLGKLYLEILRCDDLPNVDVGEAVGNVTDAFICAVFEDVMVQTPVIDDELSPRWLPWTQRAFCISIMHPASVLYLGAFDFDLGLSDHDPLGRVAVNLSNFQRDTDYTLTYNLYPSSNVTDRTSAGSVTIRLRVEFADERKALLAALAPRPKFHVNVRREKSFKVVNYVCFGEYGDDGNNEFDLTVIRSYINEILGYKQVLMYSVGDAVRSLIFWRGQVRCVNLMLPIHSLFFFWSWVILIERPYLLPPFTLIFIGWIMLATLTQRTQHPSPWHRCPPFVEYLMVLAQWKTEGTVKQIEPNQGVKDTEAYEKAWLDRVEKDMKEAATLAAQQQHIDSIGDDSIQTKVTAGIIPLDLLQRLGRYQGIAGNILRKLRLVKTVLTWEEGIISFWITACFLSAGVGLLILPWGFILTWTSRLVVWGFMGPHMMFIDYYLRIRQQDETTLAKAFEKFNTESRSARYRRQDAQKLKDIKCLAFGKYVTQVPAFNLSRHCDHPLPSSFGSYKAGKRLESIRLSRERIPGQQFFGSMIPRREEQVEAHNDQLEELEQMRVDVEKCVRDIMKNEDSSMMKKLRERSSRRDEQNMPASLGYEMVAYDMGHKSNESPATSRPLTPVPEASHAEEDTTVCSSPGADQVDMGQQSELVDAWRSGDDSRLHKSMKSMSTHFDTDIKLAVIPTREERRSLRRRGRKWVRGRQSSTRNMEDEGRDCGVEVLLEPGPDREDNSESSSLFTASMEDGYLKFLTSLKTE